MQNATRSKLPVAAGYVDALHSVLTASSAASYDTAQAPRIKILVATRTGARAQVQAAMLGSTAAIRRYRVAFGRRTVAELTARRSPFKITVRRPGASVRITALDAAGRPLTAAQRKVTKLRRGKRGVGSGGGVGA